MDDSRQGDEIARLIAVVVRECEDWSDEDWSERQQAVERLEEIGKPAVLPLIDALTPTSLGTELVIEALGMIRDTRAVEPLMAFLKQDEYENRDAAATALGRIGDVRIITPLIASVRGTFDVMSKFTTMQGVASALARLGTPAFDALITGLSDQDNRVREMSAYALGELRDARAVEPLIGALTDSDNYSSIRMAAAVALGQIGDVRAVDALVTCLSDSNKWVRIDAIQSLSYLTKGQLFAPLVSILDDPDVDIRRYALTALDANSGPAVIELLLARADDPDPCIRLAAVICLAGAHDMNLIPKLEEIRDQDQGTCHSHLIRDAAVFAIQNIPKWHKIRSS